MICAGCDDCAFTGANVPDDVHEIHITVAADHTNDFLVFCGENGIKPIVIAYGDSYLDPMTSHKFKGSISAANTEITRLVNLMRAADLPPIRIKAETTITNPVVLENKGYFESHLGIQLCATDEARLRATVRTIPQLHLSKNALKSEGAVKTIMATYRDRGLTPEAFSRNIAEYRRILESTMFTVQRQIVEYCWIDTNEDHDNLWFATKYGQRE